MTTRQTKPTKSDNMTAAIGPDPSPDVVLQALLAHDLTAFAQFSFGIVRPGILFKPNWHLEAVTYKLSQVAKGIVRRLIITLPPRTLKSLCSSVALPAWFLGHYPWERVVVVSYSDFLARTHANDFRRLVNDPIYRATFPTMRLDRDTDREIMSTMRGKRIATSIDGTLTGLGGNLIVIDDPLKLGDAMSEAVRARVIEWYRSTLLSRGDDKTTTRIVVVMQRVHQNDLVGYLMLQNRIYRGEIVHKDKCYPGEHEAIVDEALWSEVQTILTENRADRILGTAEKQVSLLSGILFDARGERMTPTHATKNNTRYRYYVSRSLLVGTVKHSGQRIPASSLEALVTRRIHGWFGDRAAMLDIIQSHTSDAATQKLLMVGLEQCVATWPELRADDVRKFMLSIAARIQVHADRIDISLNPIRLPRWLGRSDAPAEPTAETQSDTDGHFVTLTIPARLKRAGKEMKIVVEDGSDPATPDASLVRVLVRAHVIRDRLLQDKSRTLDEIAKSEGMVASYATRLFRLTLLAPDIVSAILGGKHPPELTARKLMDDTRLPLDWNEQRQSLGFA